MGADSTIVFYGIRFLTNEEESSSLQDYSDSRIKAAREFSLSHWWSTFSVDYHNEQDYLFIGKILGHIGHEGDYALALTGEDTIQAIEETNRKLLEASFNEKPKLYVQFEPDC